MSPGIQQEELQEQRRAQGRTELQEKTGGERLMPLLI